LGLEACIDLDDVTAVGDEQIDQLRVPLAAGAMAQPNRAPGRRAALDGSSGLKS